MGCEPIYENGKVIGIACRIGRKPQPKCYKCGRPATKLCDGRGKKITTGEDGHVHTRLSLKTCDRPMCKSCAHHMGNDTDLCDDCYTEHKKDHPEPEQLKF